MTFDQVMKLTSTVSSETAFNGEACWALYDTVMKLPRHSTIVEVGVEHGRSTSILAQVSNEIGHGLYLIDPFINKAVAPGFLTMMLEIGAPFHLYVMRTKDIIDPFINDRPPDFRIGLLHIDGDHMRGNVVIDCQILLSLVARGGYACFHDYGRPSLPDVKPVVDAYTKNERWEEVGTFGTLHIVKRK